MKSLIFKLLFKLFSFLNFGMVLLKNKGSADPVLKTKGTAGAVCTNCNSPSSSGCSCEAPLHTFPVVQKADGNFLAACIAMAKGVGGNSLRAKLQMPQPDRKMKIKVFTPVALDELNLFDLSGNGQLYRDSTKVPFSQNPENAAYKLPDDLVTKGVTVEVDGRAAGYNELLCALAQKTFFFCGFKVSSEQNSAFEQIIMELSNYCFGKRGDDLEIDFEDGIYEGDPDKANFIKFSESFNVNQFTEMKLRKVPANTTLSFTLNVTGVAIGTF